MLSNVALQYGASFNLTLSKLVISPFIVRLEFNISGTRFMDHKYLSSNSNNKSVNGLEDQGMDSQKKKKWYKNTFVLMVNNSTLND